MKKIISLALSVCIVITVCCSGFMSIMASAAQTIDGSSVTWSFNNINKTLTFEGEGDIPDFDNYLDEDGNNSIPWGGADYSKIVFGDGITGIGNYAFVSSISLESIVVPENITKIGECAFLNCRALRSVEIKSDKITEIDDRTFSSCSALETVILPDTVTRIGNRAFYLCSSIQSIDLPSGVKIIDEEAFNSCILLKKFIAPQNLETIGDRAFYCCEGLESLSLNDEIEKIGVSSFDGCISLKSVTIPSGLKTVAEAAFSGCKKLKEINLSEGLETIGNEAFNLCGAKNITIPWSVNAMGNKSVGYGKGGKLIDDFVIAGYENSVAQKYADDNEIQFNSLGRHCEKSGKIGDTLLWSVDDDGILTFSGEGEIGDYTMDSLPDYMHWNPTEIKLCDGITKIGAFAFFGFKGGITIPETVTEIGEKAFGYCLDGEGNAVKSEEFTISGLENTAAQRYADDNGIQFNSLGKHYEKSGKIGETLLWSVDDEGTLTFSGEGEIGDYTMDSLPDYMHWNPTEVKLCDGITKIGAFAFFGFKGGITIPETVTEIGEKAFGYCLDGEGNAVKAESFVIVGIKDSAAEKYASENEIEFREPEKPDYTFTSVEEPTICVYDPENKMIKVYNKEATDEMILADFTVGKDISFSGFAPVKTGKTVNTMAGETILDSYELVLMGDVNGDGMVNSFDALFVLQHSVKTKMLEGIALTASDINGDENTNALDALNILRVSVGLDKLEKYYPKAENPDVPVEPGLPSTAEEIASYYNNAVNMAVDSKAGFSKEKTTILDNLDGGTLMNIKIVADTVNDFLGVGTDKVTNENGNAGEISKASISANDISSASCEAVGENYVITIVLNDGTSRDDGTDKSDTTALSRTGLYVGSGDNKAFDYKSAGNIYAGVIGCDDANVDSVTENNGNIKISATVNAETGNLVSLDISYDWDVSLTNVKYTVVKIPAVTGEAQTSVKFSNFAF